MRSGTSSEVLESLFVRWSNRMPSKSLSLILIGHPENYNYDISPIDKNSEIIKKYTKSGIIKCDYCPCEYKLYRSKSEISY